MADRRSLASAMDMTPEKLAFIQGKKTKAAAEKPAAVSPAKANTVVVERSEADAEREPDAPRVSRPSGRSRSRSRTSQGTPEAGELLDQVLVSFTTCLTHRTVQTLRRFCLEQRLRHAKPDTQQEIVEEALADWLSRQGV